MYLEQTILRIMSSRDGYMRLKGSIKLNQLADAAQVIIKSLRTYYKKYDHDNINPDTLKMHVEQQAKLKEDEMPVFNVLINKMQEPVDDETCRSVIYQLKELDLSAELAELLQQYDQGDEVALYDEIKGRLIDYEHELRSTHDNMEVTDSIENILEELEQGISFNWTNEALASTIPDMRTGDQIILGARPGTGKTSFIMYEVSRMAQSVPEDRCIAWLCNEAKGSKIRLTKYRTLTGCTTAELSTIGGDACRKLIEDAGCGESRFRIFNIHGKSVYDLEQIIRDINPAIVVFDMLDNVKGFNTEARTDLRLEELYKWARDCAIIYDFLSLPTSQTSMDAEGLPFPTQEMLKDSKTGKQGACDAIIIMGKDNAPEKHNSRFFNIAKAWKGSPKEGADPTGRCEVKFDGARCQFGNSVQHNKPPNRG